MSGEVLPYSFERVWFLDCFGHVLCYTPYRKVMTRVPLQGLAVSGFVTAPYPFPKDFRPHWCNIFGDNVKMSPLWPRSTEGGFVILYNAECSKNLTINPSNNKTSFTSRLGMWEQFCPLTYDMYNGLLVLTGPGMCSLRCEDDNRALSGLHFIHSVENKPFVAAFDKKRITVMDNLDNFSRIGRLNVGETATFLFKGFMPRKAYHITITRLKDKFF